MYEIALEYDPECSDAYVGKGASFVNQKEFEKGIKEFEKALSINPNHKNAKIYLEATLKKLNEIKDEKKLKELEEKVLQKRKKIGLESDKKKKKI